MSDHRFNPGAQNGNQSGNQGAQQQSTNYTASRGAINSLADLINPTAVGNRGSQTPKAVKELLEKVALRIASGGQKQFHVCVIEDHKLKISAVAVYAVDGATVLAYPLILEECGEALRPIIQTGPNNRPIEIDMPTARYFDQTMHSMSVAKIIDDVVALGLAKEPKVEIVYSVVIKKNIKLDDENQLAPFFDSAVSAIRAKARTNRQQTTSELTAEVLANNALQLVSLNEIHPGSTQKDAFGNIVNADFNIDLLARSAVRNQNDLHNTGSEIIISSVKGYVDLAYHAPDAMQLQQARMPNNMINIPAYDAYIVITSATPLGAGAASNDDLLTQCFALGSIAGISAEMRWTSIFTRVAGDNGKKTTIGALALEHDPYTIKPEHARILPVSAGFDNIAGGDMVSPLEVIQKFCYPTMVVAMDIEQGGAMSWVQSVFANATQGSRAEEMIIKELDAFSNGAFSQIWRPLNQPIIAPQTVEVHLGYCTDTDGSIRDIRSLDYLHMLQATNGDYNIMGPYSEGFQPGRCDEVAMDRKRKTIQAYASDVVFTGIATRVFFNTAFINALDQMFAAVKLRIALEGLADISGIGMRTSAFNSAYVGQVVGHGAFHQNFTNSANYTPVNYFNNTGIGGMR